jgi:predicted RNA binding protein YcfA (HicA-like mRNA interferase family)
MATRKTRDIEAALKKKGFQREEGDHSFFTYRRASDSKKTSVFTKTSHGTAEVDSFLLGKMAKQCRLSQGDFSDLVECPLDRAAYEAKLREKGVDV